MRSSFTFHFKKDSVNIHLIFRQKNSTVFSFLRQFNFIFGCRKFASLTMSNLTKRTSASGLMLFRKVGLSDLPRRKQKKRLMLEVNSSVAEPYVNFLAVFRGKRWLRCSNLRKGTQSALFKKDFKF